MSYASWFDRHAKKHKKIVDKLVNNNLSEAEIVQYFDFDNMVKQENKFCPLYQTNTKCHDMQKLNCYLCACPHFRFNDDGLDTYNGSKILSKCDINNGTKLKAKDVIHHDCSTCSVPHHQEYILKNFDTDWKKIMKDCNLNEV